MWTPETGCRPKRAYLTKREAKVMNRSLADKERRWGRQPTHIYKCPTQWGGCGHYHLGHPGDIE